jgi:hypothetical protein
MCGAQNGQPGRHIQDNFCLTSSSTQQISDPFLRSCWEVQTIDLQLTEGIRTNEIIKQMLLFGCEMPLLNDLQQGFIRQAPLHEIDVTQ